MKALTVLLGITMLLAGCAGQDSTVPAAASPTASQEPPLTVVPGSYVLVCG